MLLLPAARANPACCDRYPRICIWLLCIEAVSVGRAKRKR